MERPKEFARYMPVVAFLQNAYVGSEGHAKLYERYFRESGPHTGRDRQCAAQDRRQQGLFDGRNYTGLTIARIFGNDLARSFWWENASPQWGWLSGHKFPADFGHVNAVLREQQPAIILTFGKSATGGIVSALAQFGYDGPKNVKLISGPHPACRQPDKYARLAEMKQMTVEALNQHFGGSHAEVNP